MDSSKIIPKMERGFVDIYHQQCNNPVEVCLGFDRTAQFLSKREMARLITEEEALKILEQAEEVALVQCTSNTLDRIEYICNPLPWTPVLCISCSLCASACPMEAITLRRKADATEPPRRGKELYLQIAQEKGRLEAFLANIT